MASPPRSSRTVARPAHRRSRYPTSRSTSSPSSPSENVAPEKGAHQPARRAHHWRRLPDRGTAFSIRSAGIPDSAIGLGEHLQDLETTVAGLKRNGKAAPPPALPAERRAVALAVPRAAGAALHAAVQLGNGCPRLADAALHLRQHAIQLRAGPNSASSAVLRSASSFASARALSRFVCTSISCGFGAIKLAKAPPGGGQLACATLGLSVLCGRGRRSASGAR